MHIYKQFIKVIFITLILSCSFSLYGNDRTDFFNELADKVQKKIDLKNQYIENEYYHVEDLEDILSSAKRDARIATSLGLGVTVLAGSVGAGAGIIGFFSAHITAAEILAAPITAAALHSQLAVAYGFFGFAFSTPPLAMMYYLNERGDREELKEIDILRYKAMKSLELIELKHAEVDKELGLKNWGVFDKIFDSLTLGWFDVHSIEKELRRIKSHIELYKVEIGVMKVLRDSYLGFVD